MKLKLRLHNTNDCLIEVVAKACLAVYSHTLFYRTVCIQEKWLLV